MTQERVGMNSDSGLFELNSLSISRSFIQQVLLVVKALKVAQFPLTSSTRKTGIGSFGLSVNTASLKGSPFGRYKINGRVLALEVSPNTGVLQREQPISVGTTACCNRLMNLTVSATQFADLFAFELLFVDGVLH